MKLISYEDFKKTDEYKKFIEENSSVGKLKVLAFTAYQAVPISDVEILITKDFGDDKVLFFNGYTNSSGVIENIELPAPDSKYNPNTLEPSKSTFYDLTAISEGYEVIKKYNIEMYGGVNSIQYIKMIPKIELEGVKFNGD